jgi:hypothetical protein
MEEEPMKKMFLFTAASFFIFVFAISVFSQVATKTGSVYGKVVDDKKEPLPGVTVTLESDQLSPQTAITGPGGVFRFANLSPGVYSLVFSLSEFTEVRQEDVRVSTGSQVQLDITMTPALTESTTIIATTPTVDTRKTGEADNFNRSYLEKVPSARDPWVIIDQTSGVDTDRYNVAGSESGQQASFVARGGSDDNTTWNYDGVNATDPSALGASPTYFDFDSFEEIQITTGGNEASIPTGGVAVNIVTKRPGNKWAANASYYFVNDTLQGTNTPKELLAAGQEKSNRLDEIQDYGFDIGGPVTKDKLFVWGAFRKNTIGLFTTTNLLDKTELKDINFKTIFNANPSNESSFGYFKGEKNKSGRGFAPAFQAEETLWEQSNSDSILQGIWTGQHTWIPNDKIILTGRYGYIGNGFSLIPRGGKDVPMIFLSAIPRYEDTSYYTSPIDRPTHDVNADLNFFKDHMIGGDHEMKFGFEYRTSNLHTFSSYGNGVYISDYYQTTPRGPLTSGYVKLQHALDGKAEINRTSFYVSDTYRKERLTLNLGVRFDHQGGKNLASTISGVPGFENFVGALAFPGNDPGIRFNDWSPRLGATFDVTGDGKTIVRGNFARYYDTINPAFLTEFNSTYVYNGATINFTNLNGDRTITQDELTSAPVYFGGLNGPIFDLNSFLAKKHLDPDFHNSWANELIAGFEREVVSDISVGATFTHRTYGDSTGIVPFGNQASDYVPGGILNVTTSVGTFSVPYSVLSYVDDDASFVTNINDYVQTYNGLDLNVRKRMSHDFMLNGSLVLQRQKAHFNGGDSFGWQLPDGITGAREFHAWDPTNVAFQDGQPYAFAPLGSGKAGVYPYSEWQLKMSGVYQFPWQLSAGAFVRYQQGYPYVLLGTVSDPNEAAFYGTATKLVLLEPFGSRRFDNIFSLDLKIEKSFDVSNYGKFALVADLFNVTNSNAVIRRNRFAQSTTFNAIDENISPRALRLGVRYSF